MSRTRVLLVGAAGETGGSIANGLLENPVFVSSRLISDYRDYFTNRIYLTNHRCHRRFTPSCVLGPFRSPPSSLCRNEEFKSVNATSKAPKSLWRLPSRILMWLSAASVPQSSKTRFLSPRQLRKRVSSGLFLADSSLLRPPVVLCG